MDCSIHANNPKFSSKIASSKNNSLDINKIATKKYSKSGRRRARRALPAASFPNPGKIKLSISRIIEMPASGLRRRQNLSGSVYRVDEGYFFEYPVE